MPYNFRALEMHATAQIAAAAATVRRAREGRPVQTQAEIREIWQALANASSAVAQLYRNMPDDTVAAIFPEDAHARRSAPEIEEAPTAPPAFERRPDWTARYGRCDTLLATPVPEPRRSFLLARLEEADIPTMDLPRPLGVGATFLVFEGDYDRAQSIMRAWDRWTPTAKDPGGYRPTPLAVIDEDETDPFPLLTRPAPFWGSAPAPTTSEDVR